MVQTRSSYLVLYRWTDEHQQNIFSLIFLQKIDDVFGGFKDAEEDK